MRFKRPADPYFVAGCLTIILVAIVGSLFASLGSYLWLYSGPRAWYVVESWLPGPAFARMGASLPDVVVRGPFDQKDQCNRALPSPMEREGGLVVDVCHLMRTSDADSIRRDSVLPDANKPRQYLLLSAACGWI